jgi:hypothetical protein
MVCYAVDAANAQLLCLRHKHIVSHRGVCEVALCGSLCGLKPLTIYGANYI